MGNVVRTWEKVLSVVVQVLAAQKEGEGASMVRHPFRLLGWGVAMNVATKFGDAYDLEIGDVMGFASLGLFDPETGETVDFQSPAIGDWIKIVNVRVSNEIDAYGKRKLRIPTAWQIRKVTKQVARLTDGGTKNGKRSRRAV